MTRRIATAILLTVWATLLIAGATAYFVTRSMLLENLDQSLMQTGVSRPEVTDSSGNRVFAQMNIDDEDRFFIRDATGRSIARPSAKTAQQKQDPAHAPKLLRAEFTSDDDGNRFRTVTFQAYAKPLENLGDSLKPVIITYRGSAAEFEQTMSLLGWTIVGSGVAGGLIAAFATRAIARAALRPVKTTADMIGAIDERALDSRIDANLLPVELKPVATRCNEMLARLQDAFARRRRFLADASHELRTPVAAMLTTLEVVLRRPRAESEYIKALRTALTDARMMRSLVEALLNQARSELDELDEPSEPVDLAAMINQVVASVSALAQQRDVHVDQDVDHEDQDSESGMNAGMVLNLQPSRLRSVLLNLIGNAIEHNRTGGRVQVIARRQGNRATLIVQDDGPGIASEHLANVFEPFYRADGSRNADGHLGLGLFLVKTHVHRMGGEISLKSEVGKGTTFTITLPDSAAGALPGPLSGLEKRAAEADLKPAKSQKVAGEVVMKSA